MTSHSFPLPSPEEVQNALPLKKGPLIEGFRKEAKALFSRDATRLALILGPCSVHSKEALLRYADLVASLPEELSSSFFPILRVFIQKPRTHKGWKGFVYDPDLDATNRLDKGIFAARSLFLELTNRGFPLAMELLDPFLTPYFSDLLTWGFIGSRTSFSQPHREMASGMDFPIGVKNDLNGDLEGAICGVSSIRDRHTHMGLGPDGKVAKIETSGNPYSHLVLRGSKKGPNDSKEEIEEAMAQLAITGQEEKILIDASHGNSEKNPLLQPEVFQRALEKQKSSPLLGIMLESHIKTGHQPLGPLASSDLSVTDSCLGWDKTRELLLSGLMSLTHS